MKTKTSKRKTSKSRKPSTNTNGKAARVVTVKGTNKGNTKAAADKTTKAVGRPDEYTKEIGALILEYFNAGHRAEAIALRIKDTMLNRNPDSDFDICAASVRKYGTREHGIAWPKGRPPQATVAAASKGNGATTKTPKGTTPPKSASRPKTATKPPRTSRKRPAQDMPATTAAQDATPV